MPCRRLTLLALLPSLAACDGGTPGAQAAASAASGAPAPKPGGWQFDGEPYEPAAVLAIGTEGETGYRVTVSRKPLDCAALAARYPEHAPVPGSLDLWLARPIAPDGTPERWAFHAGHLNAAEGGRGLVARAAMLDDVAVTGDALKVRGFELTLEERDGGKLHQFEGDLVAKSCGRVRLSAAPRPQPKLALSIAGQRTPILGATLRAEGARRYLRLTRSAHRCDSAFTEGYDFYLDLALDGEPPKVGLVALVGGAFPGSAAGSKGKDAFQVKAPTLTGDGPEVTLGLRGTLDAGGYAVAFDGEVTAQRCIAAPR